MTRNLEQELDFDVLFETLLRKTKEGKLSWQETADENAFIASVRGQQSFELSLETPKAGNGAKTFESFPIVKVKDSDGKVTYESPRRQSGSAAELYEVASRIARRVDERLQESLRLLDEL